MPTLRTLVVSLTTGVACLLFPVGRALAERCGQEGMNIVLADVELEALTRQLRRYVNKVAPLPLEATRKLHEELLAKAANARGGASNP